MKEINKKELLNHDACKVGEIISKSLQKKLNSAYESEFPGIESNFIINSKLVRKVLSLHENITGLQFAFGLKDIYNPNAVKVLIIPCTHSVNSKNAIPLISSKGYYDLDGKLVSIIDVCKLIANQAIYRKKNNSNLNYKNIERFSFIGRNMISELLRVEGCEYISFQFGYENNKITSVFSPFDSSYNNIQEIYADRTQITPPFDNGETGKHCISELIMNSNSNEKELNIIRNFRDNQLLKLQDGDWLYEMYYFISPLVTHTIKESKNSNELLRDLYKNRIQSMIKLIENNEYDKVVLLFRETLKGLVLNYEIELSYA